MLSASAGDPVARANAAAVLDAEADAFEAHARDMRGLRQHLAEQQAEARDTEQAATRRAGQLRDAARLLRGEDG